MSLIQTIAGRDYSTVDSRVFEHEGCVIDIGCLGWDWSKSFINKKRIIGVDPFEKEIKGVELFKGLLDIYDGKTIIKDKGFSSSIFVNNENGIEVPVLSWKSFCNLYNIDKISILKINAEGAEYQILLNLSREDFNKIDQIAVSFHHRKNPKWIELTKSTLEMLEKMGFDSIKINDRWDWYLARKNNKKIPKRAFFYWENDKLSWMRYITFYSFRKLHPDWQMDLYYNEKTITPEEYPGYVTEGNRRQDYWYYTGPDYSSKLKDLNINFIKWDTNEIELHKFKDITPSGKSNIFKWHQLYKNGGVYIDTDILFFKPIDELYNRWNLNNVDVVICQDKYLQIGLLASTPNNDFYKDIFYNTFKYENHVEYQTYGNINVYNLYTTYNNNIPILRSDVLAMAQKRYPHLNFFNLPMDVVYHFNHHDIAKCFSESAPNVSDFPESAIGYHWYAGGGISQKFNNLLNHKTYTDHDYLFCKLFKHYFNDNTQKFNKNLKHSAL